MKKALFILVLIMSFELFGQHPDLRFPKNWKLQSVTVNGVETTPINDPLLYPFVRITFFSSIVVTQNQVPNNFELDPCLMGFVGDLNYTGNDAFSFTNIRSLTSENIENCSVEMQNFMNLYINFYTSTVNQDFLYSISSETDGTKTLIVTNANNDIATYTSRLYNPIPNNMTVTDYWFLKNFVTNNGDNFPPSNEALSDVIFSFSIHNSESMFVTIVCDFLNGNVNFIENDNIFFIYDSAVGTTGCDLYENYVYQMSYFDSIFINNLPGPFTYELTNNDTTLTITAPNGDYAVYGNYPASITDNTINTKIVLYPNPTTNTFKIETTQNIKKVEIYSVLGKLVQTYSKQTDYDISHLSNGVYSVVVDNVFHTVLVKK